MRPAFPRCSAGRSPARITACHERRRTGWKADLIVRRGRAFSAEELQRRRHVEVLGAEVWLATAEDTVLSKLEWAARSDSTRQQHDVLSILRIRGDRLDWEYMERWAHELGVADDLRRLWQSAKAP